MVAQGGGMCMVAPGGACVVARGGMHGCSGGGHAWLLPGGVRGCSGGGMCGCSWGRGHVWDMMRYGDTVNERAVRILLECILLSLDNQVLFQIFTFVKRNEIS